MVTACKCPYLSVPPLICTTEEEQLQAPRDVHASQATGEFCVGCVMGMKPFPPFQNGFTPFKRNPVSLSLRINCKTNWGLHIVDFLFDVDQNISQKL